MLAWASTNCGCSWRRAGVWLIDGSDVCLGLCVEGLVEYATPHVCFRPIHGEFVPNPIFRLVFQCCRWIDLEEFQDSEKIR